MSQEYKPLVPTRSTLPAERKISAALVPDVSQALPSGPHWFGFATDVAIKNTAFVEAHTGHLRARTAQAHQMSALVDARTSLAARIGDLRATIEETQRALEHQRFVNEHNRSKDATNAAYELQIIAAKNEADLHRSREQVIKADRNREAALRVRDSLIDQWHAEQESRLNNAQAEFADTREDLARSSTPAATAPVQTDIDELLRVVDSEIENQKSRGNAAGAMALQNCRARIKSAA